MLINIRENQRSI